jgi:hypothetical protein
MKRLLIGIGAAYFAAASFAHAEKLECLFAKGFKNELKVILEVQEKTFVTNYGTVFNIIENTEHTLVGVRHVKSHYGKTRAVVVIVMNRSVLEDGSFGAMTTDISYPGSPTHRMGTCKKK